LTVGSIRRGAEAAVDSASEQKRQRFSSLTESVYTEFLDERRSSPAVAETLEKQQKILIFLAWN
jgi:hypothetical protein